MVMLAVPLTFGSIFPKRQIFYSINNSARTSKDNVAVDVLQIKTNTQEDKGFHVKVPILLKAFLETIYFF